MIPSGATPRVRTALVAILGVLGGALVAHSQPAAPPRPAEYRATVRYRIRALEAARIARFRDMTKRLTELGFRQDPHLEVDAEDPTQTRLVGTVPGRNGLELLRAPSVQSVLLMPAGYQLPADAQATVKVQLWLMGGLPLPRQRLLADQVGAFLGELGFQESVGYDNRGHTRLFGSIPAGSVNRLLDDLREQATGWLAPRVPVAELPLPIREGWPVIAVEVLPEPQAPAAAAAVAPAVEIPEGQDYLLKVAPDLRLLAGREDPVRMEVIFNVPPPADTLRRDLTNVVPGLQVQGRLGPLVTVSAPANQAATLAKLPNVDVVRLPHPAVTETFAGAAPASGPEALRASGLARLHSLGSRGRGVRIAIIDADFRGFERFVGKQLPVGTRYLDVSAEYDRNLQPHATASAEVVGHGTQTALAAALAAPEAELTLVRIDPETPHELQLVAQSINGAAPRSYALDTRSDELTADREALEKERAQVRAERAVVLENFGQDPASVKRREAYFKRQAAADQAELNLQQREARYLRLLRALAALKGTRVVANTLVWNEGYPVNGSSALSRYFDDRPFRAAVWLQAAGSTRGQAWSGPFRDVDGNSAMEFAAHDAAPRPGRWTTELDFLGWQDRAGKTTPDVPKARLRISVQWREPHDPSLFRPGDDVYRKPLADLRLVVLRQRDPSGSKIAADDLDVVARSSGLPERLESLPGSGSYAESVEFTVDAPGRFALRVEGRVPRTVRPPTEATLPQQEQYWELAPRVFVQVLDEAGRAAGRAIFLDYATDLGNLGAPADAQSVISVGAADLNGRREPYSAGGPPAGQALATKPDVLAFDRIDLAAGSGTGGTGQATGFAAGAVAAALSSGISAPDLPLRGGKLLRLP